MKLPVRILCACLSLLLCAGVAAALPQAGTQTPKAETLTVRTAREQGAPGALATRTYTLENGDEVCFSHFTAAAQCDGTLLAVLPRAGATVQLLAPESDAVWQTVTEPGRYPCSLLLVDYADGSSAMAYPPQGWAMLENTSRRHLGYGGVEITDTELRLYAPALAPGECADCTLVRSEQALIDWASHPDARTLWADYRNADEGRWCCDGYYRIAPATYIPSGQDVYYRLPAAYLCKSMLDFSADYRLAWDLSAAMLDVMAQQQNRYGFFPTRSGSEWLLGDYGIAPGFYDTRFNTDLLCLFVRIYNERGLFADVLARYGAYYAAYAEAHHRETASGGWLIDDYGHPDGNLPTHTSLNHQAAECILLYRLSDALADTALEQLAGRMLRAVEDTAPNWIAPDGNLHYAVYQDGSYGGTEYPRLTYNDLFELQQLLESRGLGRSAQIQMLLDSKRRWMDANGVTGYST